MRNLSRLEKRTCLSSTCYRPSMVSNAFPDQSFSPCHHREIICSCIRTPTAPAVPRRYSFYAEFPSLPSTVGFSRTPFSNCSDQPNTPNNSERSSRIWSLWTTWEGGKRVSPSLPGCARTERLGRSRNVARSLDGVFLESLHQSLEISVDITTYKRIWNVTIIRKDIHSHRISLLIYVCHILVLQLANLMNFFPK